LMLGDILSVFGTFSKNAAGYSWVAWIIGIALAIIAANMKIVMAIAGIGFMFVSGIGVLAVGIGIAVPFIVYIFFHLVFLNRLRKWVSGQDFQNKMDDMAKGIEGAKKFGKTVSNP
jgi:membrane protein implicated in regulation of membrane protease activity